MSGMIKDLRKFNRLARIGNSTFGGNSPNGETLASYSGASTQHAKYEIINEKTMKVHYQGALAVSSKSMLNSIMGKVVNDALEYVKASLERFSKEYKEEFGTSDNLVLKINESTITDNVEFTSYSIYKPTQSGMLRVTMLVDVSGGDKVKNGDPFDFDKDNEELVKKVKDMVKDALKSKANKK